MWPDLLSFSGKFLAACARLFAGDRALRRFKCGDCAAWRSCGEPPDGPCVERAMQLEMHGDRPRPYRRGGYP